LAIELNPNYTTGHHWYGLFLIILGRHQEALREIKRALDVDSLSLIINTKLGVTYYYGREYGPAIDQLRKTIEMDPRFPLAHLYLGLSYEQQGKFPDAIAEFRRGLELGENPMLLGSLVHAYGASGNRAEAEKELKKWWKLPRRNSARHTFWPRPMQGLATRTNSGGAAGGLQVHSSLLNVVLRD
jgi:adenylate cyclase